MPQGFLKKTISPPSTSIRSLTRPDSYRTYKKYMFIRQLIQVKNSQDGMKSGSGIVSMNIQRIMREDWDELVCE